MEQHGPGPRVYGAAIAVAPLLLLASTTLYAVDGGFGHSILGPTVQVYAMAGWFLVFAGLAWVLRGRFPRAVALFTVLGALGATGGITYGVDYIHVAVTGQTVEDMGIGALTVYVPGILFPLSNLAFGLMLARSGLQPRWSGVVLMVAAVCFPLSRIPAIVPLALVADCLFVVALVPLGWRLLRADHAWSAQPAATRVGVTANA